MFKGAVFVFLGACSFGILSTFVKLGYAHGFTLGEVTGVQAFLGVLLLWFLYLLQTKFFKSAFTMPAKNQLKKPTTAWKVILSGFSSGCVSIFYYQCVKLVPASIAIILLMQFVWIGVLLEMIFFRKKPDKLQVIAVFIVLLGTCFASGMFSDDIGSLSVPGIIFGLLAALAYSVFILINGRVGNDLNPLKKSALVVTGACVLIFIIFPPAFLFNKSLLFSGLLKLGIVIALFGTVIPPLFYAIGVPRAGVTLSSILSSAELPVAVCMSFFVLHEQVDWLRWLGVAIILAAIILPNVKFNKQAA